MADVGMGLGFTFEHPREMEDVLAALRPVPRRPTMVVIEGDHGIGRTTVWRAAIDALRADRTDVRSASCTPSDAPLSWTTLAELLSPFEGPALQALPERLRETLLAGAFRRVPDRPIEPALVVAATRRFMQELSSSGPLVLAIDDLQWLDRSTARVLGAALRQMDPQTPVALLVTAPTGALVEPTQPVASFPPQAIRRVRLRSWSRHALDRLLHERVGAQLARPVLDTIVDAAQGNPLFALEIARGIVERGGSVEPGGPLPIASDLRHGLTLRLAALPLGTRRLLLPVALSQRPTVSLLHEVSGAGSNVDRALRRALVAEVLEVVGDDVRFQHPLLGSLLVEGMPEPDRRRAHRRLAAVASDPEERARHLALSAAGRSERIALAIEEGARWSRARGTPSAGADLFIAAAERTPLAARRVASRRRREAARCLVNAGRAAEALAPLRDHADEAPSVADRAWDLLMLGRISFAEDPTLLLGPLEELAGGAGRLPVDLTIGLHLFLAWAHASGRTIAEAGGHASTAIALAEREGDDSLLAAGLAAAALAQLRMGHPPERATLERILSLDVPRGRFSTAEDPQTQAAWLLETMGDHAMGARLLRQRLVRARASGDQASTSVLLWRLAGADLAAGRWAKAESRLLESVRLDRDVGARPMENLATLAWLEACLGRPDAAVRHAHEAVSAAADTAAERPQVVCGGTLGSVLFIAGDEESACRHLTRTTQRIMTLRHFDPSLLRFVADGLEARVAAAHEANVRADAARLVRHSRRLGGETRGTANRARGLVLAATGDLRRAHAVLATAVEDHATAGNPFEHGRSLLALGSVERRLRQHGSARSRIDLAAECFEGLRADAWTARCEQERARVSGRAPARGSITPGDRQIVGLVAEGRTNREIARTLFLSESTVETHLRTIYRTVGVRTRAELAAHAMRDETLLPSPSP
ncbi:MAG: AAA family ATPase [Actinomycetota bacterium]